MFKPWGKILIFLIAITIGISTGSYAFATVEVATDGCSSWYPVIILNSPLPDQTFNPGDTVTFTGILYSGLTGDLLPWPYRMNFYIAEDREDLPIFDCMNRDVDYPLNCSSPEGFSDLCLKTIPTQNVFLNPWQCNEHGSDIYCNYIKYIDTSVPGYNISFLGEDTCLNETVCQLEYEDFGGGLTGEYHYSRNVNFNFSYTIPYGFSGPVRFYIALYNGWYADNWGGITSKSNWNIIYQPATIDNSSPQAVVSCDPPGCEVIQGDPLNFVNSSTDADGDDDIAKSEWYVKGSGEPDTSYVLEKTCSEKCDYASSTETVGDYTVKLYIEDTVGVSSTDVENFSIKSIIINDPPQAAVSCYCEESNPDNCNPSTCEVFQGSDVFTLNNDSTDPNGVADIAESKWYVKLQSDPDFPSVSVVSCSGICNYTPQQAPGDYQAKLVIKDMPGLPSEALKDFKIKQEISASFECSLDGSIWLDCSDNSFKIIQADMIIYLKDTSTPSEGSAVSSRVWAGEYFDETPVNNFEYNEEDPQHVYPSFIVAKAGKIYILLEITDTNDRESSIEEAIGSIPPPKWWPI